MIQLILGVCYFEAITPYKQKSAAPKAKSFGAAIFCSAAKKNALLHQGCRLFNSAFRANVRKAVKAQLGKT